MKDLKGKLIWICKGDFKEPNASCQPHITTRCRHSRLPNVSNTCPGGAAARPFSFSGGYSKLGDSNSLLLLHFFWGGSQQFKGPFQRITITHSLSSSCSSPRLARDSQVKNAVKVQKFLFYLPKKKKRVHLPHLDVHFVFKRRTGNCIWSSETEQNSDFTETLPLYQALGGEHQEV